jgi:hypothetical protein
MVRIRRKVNLETLKQFMRELATAARSPGKVYLTGGATALLLGFREQTIDIDLKLDPEPEGVFDAIADLKNRLNLNVELASPDNFIPRTADDFGLQALAKLERGHAKDLEDVTSFIRGGYVTSEELKSQFAQIEPALVRYPAIDPHQFKNKLEDFLKTAHA